MGSGNAMADVLGWLMNMAWLAASGITIALLYDYYRNKGRKR